MITFCIKINLINHLHKSMRAYCRVGPLLILAHNRVFIMLKVKIIIIKERFVKIQVTVCKVKSDC